VFKGEGEDFIDSTANSISFSLLYRVHQSIRGKSERSRIFVRGEGVSENGMNCECLQLSFILLSD